MKYLLCALAGTVGGFVVGEVVAALLGLGIAAATDSTIPLALKLMPFYLAVAGAVAAPYALARTERSEG